MRKCANIKTKVCNNRALAEAFSLPYCKSDSKINQVVLRFNSIVFDSTLAKKYAALNKEKTLKAGVETLAFSFCKKVVESEMLGAKFAICRTRYIVEFGKI